MGETLKTVFDTGPGDVRRMTEDETEVLATMVLTRATRASPIVPATAIEDTFKAYCAVDTLPRQLAVLAKRLAAFRPEQEFELDMLLLASFLSDRVALLVLWAHSLAVAPPRFTNGQPITLDTWAERLHPMGVPTEHFMYRLWDAQKDERDRNRLDDPKEWV